ncbi:MAG: hypothetical protein AAGK97_05225, partial [Bacteroidota bacterium]
MKTKILFVLTLFLFPAYVISQTNIYWGGGSGNWNDPSHWFKDANATIPIGTIPDPDLTVVFTDFSSPYPDFVVEIPEGTHGAQSIIVQTAMKFTLDFQGVSGSTVEINIYGDLLLRSTMTIDYASTLASHNVWKFVGSDTHDVNTAGLDLLSIEIHGNNTNFNQLSNLKCSTQIRMLEGVWNTNGYQVSTDILWFRDRASTSNPLTKVFNTSGSSIYCNEWDSKLTYGSLTVNGGHKIYVEKFTGSPKQPNGSSFYFDEIYLLEYSDAGDFLVNTYNFECTECIVNKLVIQDTGITKLAGKFTIEGVLVVQNTESVIQFSSGNGRIEEVIINGEIITPSASGCEQKTIFENNHSNFITLIRNNGTLVIKDAIINNVKTSGGASFVADNSIIQGASSGWNEVNVPTSLDYFWRPPAGSTGDWDDLNMWSVDGGQAECLPTIIDNVIIDESSKGNIRIPEDFTGICKNFIWVNVEGLELTLDGDMNMPSKLQVAGDFILDQSATITGVENHEIIFYSGTVNDIETEGVVLPKIKFVGELASWNLVHDLECDEFIFFGGTLNTNGRSITTNRWLSFSSASKQYNFSSSKITVNGEMSLS